MSKTKKSKRTIAWYTAVSFAVLIAAFLVAALANIILAVIYGGDKKSYISNIIGMLEGIIGAIAAGLVLYQLKVGEKNEQHQNEVEEASFTLQYNQAFIQDPNMAEVSKLLEEQAYYDTESREIINKDNRQKFINYLVYLEAMAPLIINGVLELDYIDNLMAYRFFIAIDNYELQEKEIIPFAVYYKGCFKLYKIWKAYRDANHLDCPKDDCLNKNSMRALDTLPIFDKYANN